MKLHKNDREGGGGGGGGGGGIEYEEAGGINVNG